MQRTRRDLFRTVLGGAGVAAVGSLAGCLGDSGEGTATQTPSGQSTANSDATSWYRERLPAPDAVGLDGYQFLSVELDAIRTNPDRFYNSRGAVESLSVREDRPSEASRILVGGSHGSTGLEFGAIGGTDQPGAYVEAARADYGLAEQGSYGSFTMYTGDGNQALATTESEVVFATDDDGRATEIVRTIVDTRRGEVDRYTATSDVMGRLLEAVEPGMMVSAQTHDPLSSGLIGAAASLRLGEAATTFTGAGVFESAGAADPSALEDWLGETWVFDPPQGATATATSVEPAIDGRLGTVRQRLDRKIATPYVGLPEVNRTEFEITPQVNFESEYDSSEETLTITHGAGDQLPQRGLYVRGTGFADVEGVDMTAAGQWQGTASGTVDGEEAVVAGDRVTVGTAPDYELSVVWEPGDTAAALAEFSGPEA